MTTKTKLKDTIFVSIASYRDPELIPTIDSLLNGAAHPENLHIVVGWQHAEDETTDIFLTNGFMPLSNNGTVYDYPVLTTSKAGAKVTIIDIDYLQTHGACWARHTIQQIYSKEKYALYLDSHHRFVKDWDKICISMLEDLRKDGHAKPLLTAYLPSYDPKNDPDSRVQHPWELHFDRFIPEGCIFYLPSQIPKYESLSKPVPSRFFSGHFVFVDGTHIEDVPYDGSLFFHGEEHSMAVRSYCAGYDMFSPHKVIAWHEYTRVGRVKMWDDHSSDNKKMKKIKKHWGELNNDSHKRYRILFGMDGEDSSQINFGKYGFNGPRTVSDYEEYAGIDHIKRSVTQEVLDRKFPPGTIPKDDKWEGNLIRSNDLRILFHKNELETIVDDYDFWYVGAHSGDGKEIYRKDIGIADIKAHLQNDFIDFRLIYLNNTIAKSFVVWPHSKSKGWLKRIEKPVT